MSYAATSISRGHTSIDGVDLSAEPAPAATVRGVCIGCNGTDPAPTRLIVIRGNSASGKSTIAATLRETYGRGLAVVGQDNLRRVVLREHDRPDAANIGLISMTCRYTLDHGFHTVLEGILYSAHYGEMLAELRDDLGDRSSWWFLDVPFERTVARHASKPQAAEYGRAELEQWWRGRDLLSGGFEQIITPEATARTAADRMLRQAGLAGAEDRRCDGLNSVGGVV